MRYLSRFTHISESKLKLTNENLDPDFVSEVRDVFSYVIDSYEVDIKENRHYLSFTFLFNFSDDYKGLIEDLKLDIEECLERLSITRYIPVLPKYITLFILQRYIKKMIYENIPV